MSEADVIQRVRRIALEEAKKSADGALADLKPIGSNTNNVKYNTAYYGFAENNPDKAWCVVFIWWVMRLAGVPATVFPKKASVFRAADGGVRAWFKARNRFMSASSMPNVGDLVVFKRSHIGIVENVQGNTIFTVEGNASDRVRRRSYSRSNSDIDGYCHPAYDMVEEDDMTPEQATELKAILNRVNTIREALTVEGTQTVDQGFQMLFDRVRNIEADVKEIKERIT
jgi:CHAP domain